MLDKYKTIYITGEAEIVEKKSRFIASVTPVEKEDEAVKFIEYIKKKHNNATHNVFAYLINGQVEVQRFSDDGEPSGTAGIPILEVIKYKELKNVCIVVTRYFGGTLLGTGGLIRAYSKAAKEGIQKGKIIEKVLYERHLLQVDYSSLGKVQYEILKDGYIIEDMQYTDEVIFKILVPHERQSFFTKKVEQITYGKRKSVLKDYIYGAYVEQEFKLIE